MVKRQSRPSKRADHETWTAATALSGAFMKRFAWRGAQKNATQAERAAVARQRAHWGATYRLLRGLAREDERVHSLLRPTRNCAYDSNLKRAFCFGG